MSSDVSSSTSLKAKQTHTVLCEANRCRQQARLKKPVSSVPFYFDFYRKGCVSVCLEMPTAVPTKPPVNIHPWTVIDKH